MAMNDLPVLKPPPLVCTVLPTYNERGNIGPLIDGILLHAHTPQMVLVVDENSTAMMSLEATGVDQLIPVFNSVADAERAALA